MKIIRNLKSYVKKEDIDFYLNSIPGKNLPEYKSVRKIFMESLSKSYDFAFYSLKHEMKSLLTIVQQTLCGYVRRLTSRKPTS